MRTFRAYPPPEEGDRKPVPILVQVSIAIGALALLLIAITVIRILGKLRETAERVQRTMALVDEAIPVVKHTVSETQILVSSLTDTTQRVNRLTAQFEQIGSRVARVSSLVVDEVVEPVGKAAALIRGVKTGASYLIHNMGNRLHRTKAGPDRRIP